MQSWVFQAILIPMVMVLSTICDLDDDNDGILDADERDIQLTVMDHLNLDLDSDNDGYQTIKHRPPNIYCSTNL